MQLLTDPFIVVPSALGLAILLAGTALHKLRLPDDFGRVLVSYDVFPGFLVTPLKRLVPVSELLLALALFIPATHQLAALLITGLLLSYAGVMARTLSSGKQVADCGCSVGSTRHQVSPMLVWRNLILALIALNLARSSALRPLGYADVAAIGLLTLIGCTFYGLVNSLIGTHLSSQDLFHD